jgi:hypothetical protein
VPVAIPIPVASAPRDSARVGVDAGAPVDPDEDEARPVPDRDRLVVRVGYDHGLRVADRRHVRGLGQLGHAGRGHAFVPLAGRHLPLPDRRLEHVRNGDERRPLLHGAAEPTTTTTTTSVSASASSGAATAGGAATRATGAAACAPAAALASAAGRFPPAAEAEAEVCRAEAGKEDAARGEEGADEGPLPARQGDDCLLAQGEEGPCPQAGQAAGSQARQRHEGPSDPFEGSYAEARRIPLKGDAGSVIS